jgi:Peptidase family M23
MLTIFALQIAVPAGLIAWLAIAPARSKSGLIVQATSIAITLAAIAIAGIWLFPPWWTPRLYAVLFALALALALGNRSRSPSWPSRLSGWSLIAIILAGGLYSSVAVVSMLAGSRAPKEPHVELAFPLAGDAFLVVNGGADDRINAHQNILRLSGPRVDTWRGTAHSVDLVAIDRFGFRVTGVQPANPTRYRSFGIPVPAPCNGNVVKAIDGLPDMPVPQYDRKNMAGNYVVLACGDNQVMLAHFMLGSLAVRDGHATSVGQPLARLGNSGGSDEPHLHVHAQRPGTADAPFSGQAIPVRFDGQFLVRNDRIHGITR